MPKLYSTKTILAALQRAGFSVISQRGSHINLYKKQGIKSLTVIIPNHKEIAIGTFSSILRQADMTRKELEKFIKGESIRTAGWSAHFVGIYLLCIITSSCGKNLE